MWRKCNPLTMKIELKYEYQEKCKIRHKLWQVCNSLNYILGGKVCNALIPNIKYGNEVSSMLIAHWSAVDITRSWEQYAIIVEIPTELQVSTLNTLHNSQYSWPEIPYPITNQPNTTPKDCGLFYQNLLHNNPDITNGCEYGRVWHPCYDVVLTLFWINSQYEFW
jgi:hypothetical protein